MPSKMFVRDLVFRFACVLAFFLTLNSLGCAEEGELSLDNLRVPRERIISGGPPKDGIPALTDPRMVAAQDATFLPPTARVIGVERNGQAKAYPLNILNWHEVVNDRLSGDPILVTYCPLCDSAAAFERDVNGEVLEFGVSGLLYQSNVLIYDRSKGDQSLWSQMAGRAVSGPFAGTKLDPIPVELTTWEHWQNGHPKSTVLSTDTGFRRRYNVNTYKRYLDSPQLRFPVSEHDERLAKKHRVLGIALGDEAKAYPLPVPISSRGELADRINGKTIKLLADQRSGRLKVIKAPPEARIVHSLWFAWQAFYPDTKAHDYGE